MIAKSLGKTASELFGDSSHFPETLIANAPDSDVKNTHRISRVASSKSRQSPFLPRPIGLVMRLCNPPEKPGKLPSSGQLFSD